MAIPAGWRAGVCGRSRAAAARVGIPAGWRAGVCEFEDMQKDSVFTEEEAGGDSPQVPLKEYTKLIQSRPCLPASGGRRIEDA